MLKVLLVLAIVGAIAEDDLQEPATLEFAACENFGEVKVTEQCECGPDTCSRGQYCLFGTCVDYPKCQCHSTHVSVKSPTPRTSPVCKDDGDPTCLASVITNGSPSCPYETETLCIIAIPPCACLNDVSPWNPDPVEGLIDFELNNFSCFDPQYRHKAENTNADVYDNDGQLLHRVSDGKHRCFDQPEAYSTSMGLCTGTTRRRCRMPDSPSPTPYPTQYPTQPAPIYPARTTRGYMTIKYGVNIKTPQVQMGIAADEAPKTETPILPQVIAGGFSEWSVCTTTCGPGEQTRTCDNPVPANGGDDCYGDWERDCDNDDCSVDGGFSDWSECSTTCGLGTQTRTCDNPVPENGGDDCDGDWEQECENENDCPVTPAPSTAPTSAVPTRYPTSAVPTRYPTGSPTINAVRRIQETDAKLLQSPVFFTIALGAIAVGFGIAGYYTTKMIFKRTHEQN